MRNLVALAMIPLVCMGVTILTALVIIFALRRGTKSINKQAQNVLAHSDQPDNGNTRWARGDLQGEYEQTSASPTMTTCPACGGENTSDSVSCAFCGRKL